VFADVVHENGLAQTLEDSLTLGSPTPGAWRPTDPDDAYETGGNAGGAESPTLLEDRSHMRWSAPAGGVIAGQPVELDFQVVAPTAARGARAYMGMVAHAAVVRNDAGVFVHLHPMGTVSAGSALAIQLRESSDTVRGRLGSRVAAAERNEMPVMPGEGSGRIGLPYAFPSAGTLPRVGRSTARRPDSDGVFSVRVAGT